MDKTTGLMGYHTHHKIAELLTYGDNKIKSIVKHTDGTASSTRLELKQLQSTGQQYLVVGQCIHKKPDGSCAGHILPADPQRDEQGYYVHPGMPDFADDGNGVANWIYEQQLTISVDYLYDEPATSEAFIHYFDDGGGAEKWQPTPPEGTGWFMLCLFDSEDGPICWWARHNIDHKVLSIPGGLAVA